MPPPAKESPSRTPSKAATTTILPMLRTVLRSWLPFLSWPRPSASLLRGEFLAGMTVGLMLVPQGVAYAALAGMPLITGIYASLLPALVAVLFSSSTRLGVGPTALTSLLIGASLTGLAEPGSAQWVQMAVWIALLSGALQCVMGLARFGWVVNIVTSPVLNGFTQAAALLILASQLRGPHGASVELGGRCWPPRPWGFLIWLRWPLVSVAWGALLLAKKLKPTFPAAIAVVGATGAISWATGYADAGGAVVGHLPQGLPTLHWPGWLPWSDLGSLLMPVLVVTLVSFLETASSAKVESQRSRRALERKPGPDRPGSVQNQQRSVRQLCHQRILFALCHQPVCGRTNGLGHGVFDWRGAGGAAVAHTCAVLRAHLGAGGHCGHRRVQPHQALSITRLWRVSRVESLIAIVTFGLTLATAPRMYWGVLAGLLMNLCHFLYQRLHPRIIEVGLHPDGSLRDRHLWSLSHWRRTCWPCAWMPNWTSPRPARWNKGWRKTWARTPTSGTCASWPSPSIAST